MTQVRAKISNDIELDVHNYTDLNDDVEGWQKAVCRHMDKGYSLTGFISASAGRGGEFKSNLLKK